MMPEQLNRECEAASKAKWPDRIVVFGDGKSEKPRLMLIGEAPGEQETLQRRPFVGKAGKNLDEFLEMMSLSRPEIYVSNVVKVRPCEVGPTGRLRNRPPSKEEITLFLPFLMKEIGQVDPAALVTLGNTPLKAIMGEKANVGDMHGRWHVTPEGRRLFCLYHPAAIIYRRELKQVYEQDVAVLHASLTIEASK